MSRSLRVLLAADFVLRLVGMACYTLFIAAIYVMTGKTSDIGLISAATLLPALLVALGAGRYTARWSPLGTMKRLMLARAAIFAGGAAVAITPAAVLVVAALHSLMQQGSISAKMTLDAELLTDDIRRAYNARKTMLANVAVIAGPPLGGVAVVYAGLRVSLLVMAGLSVVIALALSMVAGGQPAEAAAERDEPSARSALRHLADRPRLAFIIAIYCLVAIILAVEAPLTFPFVHEVFARGSDFTGMLLGLAGVGGIAGAYLAQRFPRILSEASIPWLIVLDGVTFLTFTQLTNVAVACVVFSLLGAMGAVTLVIVEGAVQRHVSGLHRPFVFSMMQFAGGAGGASLGILAAFVAQSTGAKFVLATSAGIEIVAGLVGVLGWLAISSRALRAADA